MTPERWLEVKRAFEAVLQMTATAREDHLERMRSSTPEIHREVISLLAAHEQAGNFLESGAHIPTPAHPPQSASVPEDPVLPAGTRLGAYEVVAFLGMGGMGKVYRGRDPRLERAVALKVLRAERCGPGGLERFQKEARALAALAHPNVLAIHDSGSEGDHVFLVTELLEGQRLRDLLQGGALPARKARAYALGMARGLAAAHDKGIVHRDLKPENVFVTRDGRVKVLDFGLARLVGPHRRIAPNGIVTAQGVLLGTVGYMSPEQARGEPADARSDIFSLGVVFYEMLTGKRPFQAASGIETLHALLYSDPAPLAEAAAGSGELPSSMVRLVERCLEKQPGERFQSAHDLAFAIDTLADFPVAAERVPRRRSRAFFTLAALAVLATAGVVALRTLQPALHPAALRALTYSGRDTSPAVSPDGRTVAFSSDRDGVLRIWLKNLSSGEEVALTEGPDDAPRFSPDGAHVLFTRSLARQRTAAVPGSDGDRTALYRVPVLGGDARKLVDDASEGDYAPDGHRIAFIRWQRTEGQARPRLFVAELDGGEQRELAVLGNRVRVRPRWSPDGRNIAVTGLVQQPGVPQSIVLVPADRGPPRTIDAPGRVGLVSAVAWADEDEVIFSQAESVTGNSTSSPARIFRQRLPSGSAQVLLLTPTHSLSLDIAGPGMLILDGRSSRQNLVELEIGDDARPARSFTRGLSTDRQPIYTPDGNWIVFSSNRSGNLDLWVLSPQTGAVRRLTDHDAEDWDPSFTPDGRSLLWSSNRSGHFEVWTARPDGSGARRVTDDGLDAENPTSGGDGSWIVYASGHPEKAGVWKVRPDGTQATRLVPGAILPEASPDGRFVLYQINRGPSLAVIGVAHVEDGRSADFEIRIDVHKLANPLLGRARWMPGMRAIAFVGQDARGVNGIFAQDFVPGQDTTATRRPLGGFDETALAESFGVSPDGKRLAVAAWEHSLSLQIATDVPGITRPRTVTQR